jgi:ATPases involved in chromosome partitioning
MGTVIAITNQKGGVGKTTTAINLSACLAQTGRRVLLIDLDPQGNSSSGLGVVRRKNLLTSYDVLIDDVPAEDAIVHTMIETLDVLPSRIALAGAEVELVSMQGREHRMKHALQPIRDRYDYILIDCPPSLGLLTLNALTASDSILVPIQCEYFALEGLSQLMNTVKLVRSRLNGSLDIQGVVLTMFSSRFNLCVQVVEEVKKHFREKVYNTIIPRSVRMSEAPSHGLPITLYDSRNIGAKAYTNLANEFIEREEGHGKE